MTSTRKTWEIEYSILCQIAAAYLTELDIARNELRRAVVYEATYGLESGGLEQWVLRHIRSAIEKANVILDTHGGVVTAPIVEISSLKRLAAMGLCGVASDADMSRTD